MLYFGGEKTVPCLNFLAPAVRFFLRFSFFKEFYQALLAAEIIMFSLDSLLKGGSFGNIGLAIRVLDKLFWLKFPPPFFPPNGHVFNKVVKNHVEEKKEENE
jgi:hypothetical protein